MVHSKKDNLTFQAQKAAQAQAQKAGSKIAQKAVRAVVPAGVVEGAGLVLEIGAYIKMRRTDGVPREEAVKRTGYELGKKGSKMGVSMVTMGLAAPIIDMLEARVFQPDMDKRNIVRMTSTAKMLGMALGMYGGSFVVFPLVGASASAAAGIWVGKNAGEFGGRVFVDMTGIKGPLDIYKILEKCCESAAESSDSVLPKATRNLWGTDNDYKNEALTDPSFMVNVDPDDRTETLAGIEEIIIKIESQIDLLSTKRVELYKESTAFAKSDGVDNEPRVQLYRDELVKSLKEISIPLRERQLSLREKYNSYKAEQPEPDVRAVKPRP
jgi:hypothetical protein